MAHWFKYAFSILIQSLQTALAYSDVTKKYIHNISDFQYHTAHHIQNVISLGLFLHSNPSTRHYFSDLTREAVVEYLSLHDSSKRMPLAELQNYKYTNEQTIEERLFSFYGKDKDQLPPQQQDELKQIIEELNRIDTLVSRRFLYKKGYILNSRITAKGMKLIIIEQVADLVERTKNPVSIEEFGKMMKSPEVYVKESRRPEFFRLLMNHYHEIADHRYQDILIARHPIVDCKRFFE